MSAASSAPCAAPRCGSSTAATSRTRRSSARWTTSGRGRAAGAKRGAEGAAPSGVERLRRPRCCRGRGREAAGPRGREPRGCFAAAGRSGGSPGTAEAPQPVPCPRRLRSSPAPRRPGRDREASDGTGPAAAGRLSPHRAVGKAEPLLQAFSCRVAPKNAAASLALARESREPSPRRWGAPGRHRGGSELRRPEERVPLGAVCWGCGSLRVVNPKPATIP